MSRDDYNKINSFASASQIKGIEIILQNLLNENIINKDMSVDNIISLCKDYTETMVADYHESKNAQNYTINYSEDI